MSSPGQFALIVQPVALHPEGVDRNFRLQVFEPHATMVALHPEGVDRNIIFIHLCHFGEIVALHPEGVDRNIKDREVKVEYVLSPSTRRAWIEI